MDILQGPQVGYDVVFLCETQHEQFPCQGVGERVHFFYRHELPQDHGGSATTKGEQGPKGERGKKGEGGKQKNGRRFLL